MNVKQFVIELGQEGSPLNTCVQHISTIDPKTLHLPYDVLLSRFLWSVLTILLQIVFKYHPMTYLQSHQTKCWWVCSGVKDQ